MTRGDLATWHPCTSPSPPEERSPQPPFCHVDIRHGRTSATSMSFVADRLMRPCARAAWALLPARKTLARGAVLSSFAVLPALLLLATVKPLTVIATVTALALGYRALGFTSDVAKQLRWAKKMSCRGPIVWGWDWSVRAEERLRRRLYGDSLDVLPDAPTAVGASTRTTTAVVVRWKVRPVPRYSRQTYDAEMAAVGPAGSAKLDWSPCVPADVDAMNSELRLSIGELSPGAEYGVRVRATNARGSSAWREGRFTTKQAPVEGGGTGPGYTWKQTRDEVSLTVPVGAGARAKTTTVECKAGKLRVVAAPAEAADAPGGGGSGGWAPIIDGALFGDTDPEGLEWEMSGSGSGRILSLTLAKRGPATW